MSSLDRTVREAILFSRGQILHPSQSWEGLCQSHCRQAYGVRAWAPSAITAWGKIPRREKVVGRPVTAAPRGALLYYAGGKYGHVAIAAGIKTHDKCLSNDYVRQGKIDYAPRTFPGWGLRYLGYSFWTPFGELKH
jgi:hypothetical protein